MRKYLVIILGIIAIFCFAYASLAAQEIKQDALLNDALVLLKFRNDRAALVIFERILLKEPDNLNALWGKAEILKRSRDYKQSEVILNKILNRESSYAPALLTLAYIRYKEDKLNEAKSLIEQVLNNDKLNNDNQALSYVLLGTIHGRIADKCGPIGKISHGKQVKYNFLKAREFSTDLPEVYLALGSFYLLAPTIIGGDLDKGIEALEYAVKIAPDFASANARLAQCYKKKGNLEKYNFYISRAKELDPQNEVLQELNKN